MNRNIFLLAIVMVAVCLSGCSPLKKMKKNADQIKYTTNPSQLAVAGDEVAMTLDGVFPAKYFKKKVLLTVTPVLKSSGDEAAFDSYIVQGESVRANNSVIPYLNGGSLSYKTSVPFTDALRAAQLNIKAVASKGKKQVEFPTVQIGDGVNTTATLVSDNGSLMMAPDSYQQITANALEADIQYVINQSAVRTSETKKDEVKQFLTDVVAATENDRVKILNTQISAYASPDGALNLNESLANARQNTAKTYFAQQMKKAKTPDLASDDLLQLISTPEDWEGFKALMEESNIADKQLILRVLSMYDDPAVREKEIKNIAAAYEEVKETILPQLRRSKMILNYELIGLSLDEIKAQYASDATQLTADQLLFMAAATDELAQKTKIYQTATQQYADDLRAWNNLGVALLEANNVAAAQQALTKAQSLAAAKNNLGVIALQQGDLAKAQELFLAAASSDEVKANLGAVAFMQGKYTEATNYLGNLPTENAALNKLVANQNDAALSILNQLDPSAEVSYMKAIVAARKNEAANVYSNLKDAIQKDASYKKAVLTDVEFSKYLKESAMQAILQ